MIQLRLFDVDEFKPADHLYIKPESIESVVTGEYYAVIYTKSGHYHHVTPESEEKILPLLLSGWEE